MNQPELDDDERQILQDFEEGAFQSVMTPEGRRALAEAARVTVNQARRIHVRVKSRDLAPQRPQE